MSNFQVFDWYGNDVGSPIFKDFDDATDWVDELIGRIYPDLTDEDYEKQIGEYVIHDLGGLDD